MRAARELARERVRQRLAKMRRQAEEAAEARQAEPASFAARREEARKVAAGRHEAARARLLQIQSAREAAAQEAAARQVAFEEEARRPVAEVAARHLETIRQARAAQNEKASEIYERHREARKEAAEARPPGAALRLPEADAVDRALLAAGLAAANKERARVKAEARSVEIKEIRGDRVKTEAHLEAERRVGRRDRRDGRERRLRWEPRELAHAAAEGDEDDEEAGGFGTLGALGAYAEPAWAAAVGWQPPWRAPRPPPDAPPGQRSLRAAREGVVLSSSREGAETIAFTEGGVTSTFAEGAAERAATAGIGRLGAPPAYRRAAVGPPLATHRPPPTQPPTRPSPLDGNFVAEHGRTQRPAAPPSATPRPSGPLAGLFFPEVGPESATPLHFSPRIEHGAELTGSASAREPRAPTFAPYSTATFQRLDAPSQPRNAPPLGGPFPYRPAPPHPLREWWA